MTPQRATPETARFHARVLHGAEVRRAAALASARRLQFLVRVHHWRRAHAFTFNRRYGA